MNLKTPIIAVIMFTAVLTAGLQFGSDVFGNYDVPVNSEDLSTLKDLKARANSTQAGWQSTATKSAQDIGGDIESGVFIIRSAFQGLYTAVKSALFIPDIISVLAGIVPTPRWARNAISSIIVIMVVFTVFKRYGGA